MYFITKKDFLHFSDPNTESLEFRVVNVNPFSIGRQYLIVYKCHVEFFSFLRSFGFCN